MTTKPDVQQKSFRGVYSTPFEGGTAKSARTIYWAAYDLHNEWIEVQPLSEKLIPVGTPRRVALDDFERHFAPERSMFVRTSQVWERPDETPLAPAPEGGAADFHQPRSRAVQQAMAALRAEALVQLEQGRLEQALAVYNRILGLAGPLEPGHKFVLNDCGIDLRKVRCYDEALAFYRLAMEVEENDEHLYHNAARAMYEKGDAEKARTYLVLSLAINPEFVESRRFLRYIEKRA